MQFRIQNPKLLIQKQLTATISTITTIITLQAHVIAILPGSPWSAAAPLGLRSQICLYTWPLAFTSSHHGTPLPLLLGRSLASTCPFKLLFLVQQSTDAWLWGRKRWHASLQGSESQNGDIVSHGPRVPFACVNWEVRTGKSCHLHESILTAGSSPALGNVSQHGHWDSAPSSCLCMRIMCWGYSVLFLRA